MESKDEPLSSRQFQDELDTISECAADGGWVFVFRNQIPTALGRDPRLYRYGVPIHHADGPIRNYFERVTARGERLLNSGKHPNVTVVIPSASRGWFSSEPGLFSLKKRLPSGQGPSSQDLERVWDEFKADWGSNGAGALHLFNPNTTSTNTDICELESDVRKKHQLSVTTPIIGKLPDVWLGVKKNAAKRLYGASWESDQKSARDMLFNRLALPLWHQPIDKATRIPTGGVWDTLEKEILADTVCMVNVSPADLNARFRGWRIRSFKSFQKNVVHGALAYGFSVPA